MSPSITILASLELPSNLNKNWGNDAALHAFRGRGRHISQFLGRLWARAGHHSNANGGELCGETGDPGRLTPNIVAAL